MKKWLGAFTVAVTLAGGLVAAQDLSDTWDGMCALICPWSSLCVPPLCWPSGTGGIS